MKDNVVKSAYLLVKGSIKRFVKNDGFVYSASISFNVMLAAIPFLFLLVLFSSYLFPELISDQNRLREIIASYYPFKTDFIVQNILFLYKQRGALGILGAGALFLISFSLTNTIHVSLSAMLTGNRGKNFLKIFLSHAAGILIFSILFQVGIYAWSFFSFLSRFTSSLNYPIMKTILNDTISFITLTIPFILLVVTTFLVYRHLSPIAIPRMSALIGGVSFAISIFLLKEILVFYVWKVSKLSLIYGSIFWVICFIIASYFFASVFLFTACMIGEFLKGGSVSS